MGNIHVKLYEIWTSCSGGDVLQRKSSCTDGLTLLQLDTLVLTVLEKVVKKAQVPNNFQ